MDGFSNGITHNTHMHTLTHIYDTHTARGRAYHLDDILNGITYNTHIHTPTHTYDAHTARGRVFHLDSILNGIDIKECVTLQHTCTHTHTHTTQTYTHSHIYMTYIQHEGGRMIWMVF